MKDRQTEDTRTVEEQSQLVTAFQEIGRSLIQTTERDELLDVLMEWTVKVARLRSLTVGIVDRALGKVTIVRQIWRQDHDGNLLDFSEATISYDTIEMDLNGSGLLPEVARTGTQVVIDGWDDRFSPKDGVLAAHHKSSYADKVSYFIPVAGRNGVVAVLATGSTGGEKANTLHSIEAMEPLLDQFAIALEQTRLIGELRSTAQGLEQTNRILTASQDIGRDVLAASTLDEIVEKLMISVGKAGLFRSLSFALVDHERQVIRLLRTMMRKGDGQDFEVRIPPEGDPTRALPFSSRDVMSEVVRTGQPITIEGWDDRFVNAASGAPLLDPAKYEDKVSYFLPVTSAGRVTAVLATASTIADRPSIEQRLRTMQPLFGQLAVAIDHVQLIEGLSGEAERLDTLVTSRERENLTLLRISQLVQEMSSVDELETVIRGISRALDELGFDFVGFTIHRVLEDAANQVESYHLKPNGEFGVQTRSLPEMVKEWRDRKVLYWPDVEACPGNLGPEYFGRAYRVFGIKVASILTVPYRHGTMTLRSTTKDAFSEEQQALFERVGSVLSVGISRLNDLEQLEAGNTEQEMIIAISRSVLGMRRSEDVESVLRTYGEQLRRSGVQFDVLTYNILQRAEDHSVLAYRIRHDGAFSSFLRSAPTVWERWRSGESIYKPRMNRHTRGIHVRSSLHIPNVGGVIVLHSGKPDAFPEVDRQRIDRLTEPLSLGFARLSDLQESESRAAELSKQEALVREEKEFSEGLIASMREGLCVLSPEGTILDVNPALCEMTGFSREELIGSEPPHPFWPAEQTRRMRALMLRVARGQVRDYDLSLIRKDGSRFPAIVAPSRTKETESRGVAYFATIRDISEQREIQAERIHSQRLRVIGELSAGVSHNLNNILTSILGPAQLLEMKTDDPNLLKDIETIRFSATRAADLVKRLSWTTADRREDLGAVDLKTTVEQVIRASRPKWRDEAEVQGARIDVVSTLVDTPPIRGTQAGLHDMLLNLIFNAVDAMPEGGKITITTDVDGGDIVLVVRDTGIGMSEQTKNRVFEPFFTTKMDVGSGLGLSTLFGTLRGWGGSVAVTSTPGRGAEFVLRFKPWLNQGSSGNTASAAPASDVLEGSVLIVDDDPFVGEFLATALARTHRTTHEIKAPKSIEVFESDAFDVAILDLGMPDMTGDVVARKFRKIDPAVALIGITGWELDPDDPRREPFDYFLKKPFDSIRDIEETVQEAIRLSTAKRARDANSV